MDKVSVSKVEYAQLIRESERLRIVTDYVKATEYISKETMMVLLGIKEESEG